LLQVRLPQLAKAGAHLSSLAYRCNLFLNIFWFVLGDGDRLVLIGGCPSRAQQPRQIEP